MKALRILILFFALISCSTKAQEKSCSNDIYGGASNRLAVQLAMFDGNENEVWTAINRSKTYRGLDLGCPQECYGPRIKADTVKPSISDVEALWNELYVPFLTEYRIACPELGRSVPSLALGAYYARLAGYFNNMESLSKIGMMMEAQQYSSKYVDGPLISEPGIFGYFYSEGPDECQLTGVPGKLTNGFCSLVPEFCIQYSSGLFEGIRFAVRDHIIKEYNRDNIDIDELRVGDIGGSGFDMGWAGVQMIEAAIQQDNENDRALFKSSALLAGEWALKQPLVTNHNYTSKLTWLIAELYNWTGREDFKQGLIDRLNRNLKPGVLMDLNNDGLVDGVEGISFESLHPIARIPGRNYDGHNALPWYHSMNATAAVEAYVAFRDRGDDKLARDIRPYAIAMLNNLAYEMLQLGLSAQNSPGSRDIPFSLLLGIWKIAQYENDPHPEWEKAVWAIWNHGTFKSPGARGLNLGLYLLILNEVPY